MECICWARIRLSSPTVEFTLAGSGRDCGITPIEQPWRGPVDPGGWRAGERPAALPGTGCTMPGLLPCRCCCSFRCLTRPEKPTHAVDCPAHCRAPFRPRPKSAFILPSIRQHLDYMEARLAARDLVRGDGNSAEADIRQMSLPLEARRRTRGSANRPRLMDFMSAHPCAPGLPACAGPRQLRSRWRALSTAMKLSCLYQSHATDANALARQRALSMALGWRWCKNRPPERRLGLVVVLVFGLGSAMRWHVARPGSCARRPAAR